MSFKKLWTKLFTRNDVFDEIALHSAGAIIRHRNPFENIEVPRNEDDLTEEFIEKWVVPFYSVSLSNANDITIETFAETAVAMSPDIVLKLLGDFDWRTRITGAYFSAINNYHEFEDIIGKHLLKSEVCYAGTGYCLALATFGTDNAKQYLVRYLDYYLGRKDLWFDQADAFCALAYLDKSQADKLIKKWNSFVANKQNWNLENHIKQLSNSLQALDQIREIKTLYLE
ncbi:DUF6000 family protein [Arcicella sp. DC2W]|uniref:DUF6000 family protein n=1 Tax=Arcicella gelida TaxID=2984195 RepID=A0ABU5SCB3_9BACT|nr:DUF6000 family protein [Arcicella sp. DC2W]MEA5405828.1 DUF6000 family protein [Arcicella sp. DC2W]